jgi:hypothetical protein
MCVIVDANRASLVFGPPHEDYRPILDWLDRGGMIVFGAKLARELDRVDAARRYLRVLVQAGRAYQAPKGTVESEQAAISATSAIRSDDPHVLALARVTGTRLLCTNDERLIADFKDKKWIDRPRGKIYRTKAHFRLLGHTSGCPFTKNRATRRS